MHTAESEVKSAPYAWAAARDARQRSLAAQTHYSNAQQASAERMRFALELLYYCRGVHVNYRQKFIAVKVDAARVRDRKELCKFEADWDRAGIKKLLTNQGVVYRIPKA